MTRVFPSLVAVVVTSLPSAVVSVKGSPRLNTFYADLKVELVLILIWPSTSSLVAVG